MRDLCDFKIKSIKREGAWIEVIAQYYEGENKVWPEDNSGSGKRYGRQAVVSTERFNFPHDTPDEDILRAVGDDLVTKSPKPSIPEVAAVRLRGIVRPRQ